MDLLILGCGLVLLAFYLKLRRYLIQKEREEERNSLIQRINAGIYYDHIYGDDHEY